MPIRYWPGMTVPGRKAKPDPNRVIRGTRLNTFMDGGASCVQILNREKKVKGLNGHKSHVHVKHGPDPRSVFQRVKAHGAIDRANAEHWAERLRVLSLEIDQLPDGCRLEDSMRRYVEMVERLNPRQVQRQVELETARGVVRCSVVRRQLHVKVM
jgi:hypothetical protein